ncbi:MULTISPECIES: hypothetical protein [unclassified Caloramator]|uniref:hypothetical protein n=1 Tax=unclassified Caloramator TaxID=2629145 RepID=UPI00237D8014|nr:MULTISPECIES: hypothetical protein [unclassified Caloramator]MDO6354165.1 hypothetical protein [Caloramator sp. CAR-1]WDU83183.1 hypothetical protein PWK10_17920 [Caloramator sp. Dgby_cultured_2]
MEKDKEDLKLEWKDILAIMIAQFEILMPLVLIFWFILWVVLKIITITWVK